jgi:toxin-antitoxin system PIN domain toxin
VAAGGALEDRGGRIRLAVLLGFVRISTNPVVLENPLSAGEALDYVDGWLDQPVADVVHPTPDHASILRGLLEPTGAAGNLTSDAHLAALAIEHGAELCSCDPDFARFTGLRWVEPSGLSFRRSRARRRR